MPSITLKQLSYALAAEKTLHFKNAAELCHISQSTLSTALTELEKQLGIQLFERDNKKVLVTPIGKQILAQARDIIQAVEDLQQSAERHKPALSFPIALGVIPTIAPYLLPVMLPLLKERYPFAQISIVEEQSHELVERVRHGELDAAILALPYPCEGLLKMEFWQEDFYWVAPKDHTLIAKGQIDSEDIINSKLMLLKDGHCLKDQILDVCNLSNQTANQGFGVTTLNTLIQMVIGGLGTTIIPEMALKQLTSQHRSLRAVPLKQSGPHRRIAFIIRPNYTRLSTIEILKALCIETLSNKQAKS